MEYLDEQLRKKKFEQFFIITYPKVKAFACKLLGSEEDAEDIAQDLFVKLWSNPEIWEDQDTWNGYIFSMTRNSIYDFIKHKNIVIDYKEEQSANTDIFIEPIFQEEIYANELQIILDMALDGMPEQRRNVFNMSRKQGMTNQEIADNLHISIRTVERHIYLALQTLKKIILFTFFSTFV